MSGLQVVVVTGMSGAGRSTALNVLEDLGFFCVDNIPPSLAPALVDLVQKDGTARRVGLGIDVRMGSFLEGAESAFETLSGRGHEIEVLFLECSDDVLVRRFSETRRPHALAPGGDLLAAIQNERERLSSLRERARQVIDTTELSVHDLRRAMVDHVARGNVQRTMATRIVSFGFKYGLPVDADLVFDLRFLPNPHFVPELRPLAGTDSAVSDYVLRTPEAEELVQDVMQLLRHTLPRYAREGKAYLTIAIGCTGGRHRSVAVTEEIARLLPEQANVVVVHRDVHRSDRRRR